MKKSIYFFITMIFPIMLTAQWQQVYSPQDVNLLNNIKFFDEETGVLLADNGLIEMTQDGGQSWNAIAYADQTAAMNDFFVFGSNNFVALSNQGSILSNIMVSHNSGALWNLVSPDLSFPEAVDFLNNSLGFCGAFGTENATLGHAIYRLGGIGPYQSVDQVYFTGQDGYFDHILCLNEQLVLASFEVSDGNPNLPNYSGILLRSDDQGNSWTQVLQPGNNIPFLKLGKSIDGSCLYAHTPYGVFYSTDEGLTWEEQPIFLMTLDLLSRQTAYGVVVTTGGTSMIDTLNLAFTNDAWQTWVPQLKIPFDPTFTDRSLYLQMLSENTGYFAYCNHLYKTTNGGYVGINEKPANTQSGLSIYPNPANDHILIELPYMNSNLTVEVFGSDGSKVYSTQTKIGQQCLNIDCSVWNPGIYYIRTTDMSGKMTKSKLIVQ